MRGHDGESRRGPVRRQRRCDLGWHEARNVAGHCHHACPPLTDEQARGGGDGAGMAFARAFRDDARAITRRKRCRDRVNRDDKHAGKSPDRAHSFKHVLEHGPCELTPLVSAQA